MQRQVFSYNFIREKLEDSGLSVITIPLCKSKDLYSHVIYDSKVYDILYILRQLYELNLFNEREIIDKYCVYDSLNYILYSKTNIPAVAIVNAETFDLEVETNFNLSTSKHFLIFREMFLLLEECISKLETKKYELEDEYDNLEYTYTRIKEALQPSDELLKIYKEEAKKIPFYNFKEKKKWKAAIKYIKNSSNKFNIVKKELINLQDQMNNNTELKKNCEEEYLCLLSCKNYLDSYISNYQSYIDVLSRVTKTVMEAAYEQEEAYSYYRHYNGRENINSESIS